MKRYIFTITISIMAVMVFMSPLLAEEAKEDRVSTIIMLKNDFYEHFQLQKVQIYWHKGYLGGGFDVDLIRQKDFVRVKPYATINSGPWYLLAGSSFVSSAGNTSEYAQIGFWYLNKIGNWNVIFDTRSYFGLNQKSLGFIEEVYEVNHPVVGKWYAGVGGCYDHWFQGNPHDWFLIGPLVGYRFTEKISAYVRVAHEWDMRGGPAGKTTEANSLRVGMNFSF